MIPKDNNGQYFQIIVFLLRIANSRNSMILVFLHSQVKSKLLNVLWITLAGLGSVCYDMCAIDLLISMDMQFDHLYGPLGQTSKHKEKFW